MSVLTLDLKGVPQLQRAIKKIERNATEGLSDELKASVLTIQRDMKKRAPKNMGTLAQGIGTAGAGLTWEAFATASYAGYIEFGTKGKVRVPAGYEAMAAAFKGRGTGTFKDMIKALTLWVKRKGIAGKYSPATRRRTGGASARSRQDKSVAYAIAISILRKGIRPQPFAIPSYEAEKPKLLYRLKRIFR